MGYTWSKPEVGILVDSCWHPDDWIGPICLISVIASYFRMGITIIFKQYLLLEGLGIKT